MTKPLREQQVLVIAPTHNALNRKDVTGAFLPEARAFLRQAGPGSELIQFDNSKLLPARRKEVVGALQRRRGCGFTSVAFLTHGWLDGMQSGFQRAHVSSLATEIVALTDGARDVSVPLFCCSTGDDPEDDAITTVGTGDDSFADKLRDALCAAGAVDCRVMGHTTVAHTTHNPMVLFFEGTGSTISGLGGFPPVSPRSQLWARWVRALREGDLRFRMPYMSIAQIHSELAGGLGLAEAVA